MDKNNPLVVFWQIVLICLITPILICFYMLYFIIYFLIVDPASIALDLLTKKENKK